MFGLIVYTLLVSGHQSLEWSNEFKNHESINVCLDDAIRLPWNFSLTSVEAKQDLRVTWTFRETKGSNQDVAVMAGGQFSPLPAFGGRLKRLGSAGLEVSQAGFLDAGNYTVKVSLGSGGQGSTYSKTAHVVVVEAPRVLGGVLTVEQSAEAVFDNDTQQWKAQLTCGNFTSTGYPHVHPIWETPDGHKEPSSGQIRDGAFPYYLPNPPSPGTYACRLPVYHVPAVLCLPPNSTLMRGAPITVDDVKARLFILDAQQKNLTILNERLKSDVGLLKAENVKLSADNVRMRGEVRGVVCDNSSCSCSDYCQAVSLADDVMMLKSQVSTLVKQVAQLSKSVTFHARLVTSFTGTGRLQPFTAVTNQAQGFNPAHGFFTAPFTGSYFLVATTGTGHDKVTVSLAIVKEGQEVAVAYLHLISNSVVTATVHAAVRMESGERVWLQSNAVDDFNFNESTQFSGFLIHAEE